MMRISVYQLKFLGSLILIGVVVFLTRGLISFKRDLKADQMDICLSKKKESFSGKVVEVYVSWKTDSLNVFAFKINGKGAENIIYNYCLEYPESYIEKGDSIYKPPVSVR